MDCVRLASIGAATLVATVLCGARPLGAQSGSPSGLEIAGLPVVSFDTDEGFGYGALAELYHYGDGSTAPYEWTLQPTFFRTVEGRQDLTVFFDAPGLLADGWRLRAFVGSERQIATPYYGLGNASAFDEALEARDGPNPQFYRFGHERRSATFALQRPLASARLSLIVGAGLVWNEIDPTPNDEGGTLFATEHSGVEGRSWSNFARVGLVWDSRDRESGTRSGSWTELLLFRSDLRLGSDHDFTRWTFTDRRYVPLTPRLVFAQRVVLQSTGEDAPVYDLSVVQGSFRIQEGLGGSDSVRGLLKNRYLGRGLAVWNAELRWRVLDFELLGRSLHAVASWFVDHGRVWSGPVRLGEVLSDLHRGYGGGLRLGMGENFVAGADVGTSRRESLQIYIGLGYLF